MKKYTTTRKVYKAVKSFDHQQFDNFCQSVYASGFEDGQQAVKVDTAGIVEIAAEIKGIGSKRLEEFRKRLEAKNA